MLYELIFRLAGLGLTLAGLGFLIWCWFAFREDRKPDAIYERSTASFVPISNDEDRNSSRLKDRHLKISA